MYISLPSWCIYYFNLSIKLLRQVPLWAQNNKQLFRRVVFAVVCWCFTHSGAEREGLRCQNEATKYSKQANLIQRQANMSQGSLKDTLAEQGRTNIEQVLKDGTTLVPF